VFSLGFQVAREQMRRLLCGGLTQRRTRSEERAYCVFMLDIGKRRKFIAVAGTRVSLFYYNRRIRRMACSSSPWRRLISIYI
jgi:hypothetical protein